MIPLFRQYEFSRKLNKKQIYKIEQMKSAKSIYFCECQKAYLSFPALYLHAKSKHNVKLTTKITPKVCKIVIEDGVEKITYFIDSQSTQNQQNFPNQDFFSKKKIQNKDDSSLEIQSPEPRYNLSVQHAINIYLTQNDYESMNLLSRDKILKEFYTFIINTHTQNYKQNEQYPKPTAFNCPLFLNSFVSLYLPAKFEKAYFQLIKDDICSELFHFSKWLKNQKMTEFTVNYSPNWDY